MSLLRSLGLFWRTILQILRAYGAGFADDRPANPVSGWASFIDALDRDCSGNRRPDHSSSSGIGGTSGTDAK